MASPLLKRSSLFVEKKQKVIIAPAKQPNFITEWAHDSNCGGCCIINPSLNGINF